MTEKWEQTQAEPGAFRAVLTPHRSLGPTGFLILMVALGAVSFVTGLRFPSGRCLAGARLLRPRRGADLRRLQAQLPLRAPLRDGRADARQLTWTRVHPSGRREQFDCNPYWARVNLREWPDGRTDLRLVAQGKELVFGRFLTDDERRDLATALTGALVDARGGVRIYESHRKRVDSRSLHALSQGQRR